MMTRLVERALLEARQRGGRLAAVQVRLGALASSSPEHFREDFEHVSAELGAGRIDLSIEVAPDHPAGVELLSIEIAR